VLAQLQTYCLSGTLCGTNGTVWLYIWQLDRTVTVNSVKLKMKESFPRDTFAETDWV
jgi:hypothetical protein